ncbi:MAG: hypothetical protein ACI8PZ_004491 [Myxococcota bacterium]|jgi:hypothetical protein
MTDVDLWFSTYDSPMKPVVAAASSDPAMP